MSQSVETVSAMLAMLLVAGIAPPARGQATASATQSCGNLTRLSLPQTKIVMAQSVAAGAFSGAPFFKAVPAFCRVAVESTPTSDSDIKIEVWLPASAWNGTFSATGNGGFAGSIDYRSMGLAVEQGYATAGTDTGHAAEFIDARWALGHPEKITDFGYRGIHQMTEAAKAVIRAYYGNSPRHSYFGSCSDGGREALMEAQRFPEDYDGIIAGAPANFWTHLLTNAIWVEEALTAEPNSYIPSSKLPAIANAVNAACDAQDGVKDGIVNDPRKCHFDPAVLSCKGAESDACLTAPEVTALKKLYEPSRDSKGRPVFPGFLPGAEEGQNGWAPWITGPGPGKSLIAAFGNGFFADMVYDQSDWDYKKATIDGAVKAADDKLASVLNSTNPDLTPFRARGGKLILYHGWNDPAISALNTIDYFESVVRKMGEKNVNSFVQLYMVPGMQHCGGGPGPWRFGQPGSLQPSGAKDSQHDLELALESWVENDVAPSSIVTTKYIDDDPTKGVQMTRPLCPYPLAAKYKGAGDTNDAANFVCSPE